VGIRSRSPFYLYSLIDILSSQQSLFFKKVGYLALYCLIWRHIRLATLHPSSPLSFLKGPKSSIY
jgi:hypothetical protein